MTLTGWKRLLAEPTWCRGQGNFPLPAYSEFMPPPWLGLKPYGTPVPSPHQTHDNWGWHISEYEWGHRLHLGLRYVARRGLAELARLGRGEPLRHTSQGKLHDNPYWPKELAAHAGRLTHERYVLIWSLALSRTQNDKGRVLWTLFGSSEQGPARAFWKGFYTAPGEELPRPAVQAFFRRLLGSAYGVAPQEAEDPARAGLRVLPIGKDERFPLWAEEPFPSWCDELFWREGTSLKRVRYLLTFRPFARLPAAVQEAYVRGELHLLPFPGSLLFWGAPFYRELQRELPFAMQVPLVQLFGRYTGTDGLRVPQSGWLDDRPLPITGHVPMPLASHYQRTSRQQKIHRDQDPLAVPDGADHITHVLFGSGPNDLGLYDKPMARNAQVWNNHYRLLLDGPRQGREAIDAAERIVCDGGQFGYRFSWPAMRVGPWELYWQFPLIAMPSADSDQPTLIDDGPLGYLTAYRARDPDLGHAVELWPRLLQRPPHQDAVALFADEPGPTKRLLTAQARGILESFELLGERPLSRSFAAALVNLHPGRTIDDWLAALPEKAADGQRCRNLVEELERCLEPPAAAPEPPEGLTFRHTGQRRFEVAYWKTIAFLAHGRFRNKATSDCVQDAATRKALRHHRRDLDALAAYFLRYYARAIADAGLRSKAWAGEHAFRWRTDFDFSWWGGWVDNQTGALHERNVLVRIPGRDPTQAVIFADHFDTAYMLDRFDPAYGGTGARVAAAGADDNHSASAALMRAAPVLLRLSKAGRLGCDVWLVHLTGEEFPADCLGARHLSQALVEGNLVVKEPKGTPHDLSGVRVRGVYVCDMIAHNNSAHPYTFQIAPGEGPESVWLAWEAHQANLAWNAWSERANRRAPRRGLGPGRRREHGTRVPELARCAALNGEVRPCWSPRSTLYNTDGQIFSDVGIPVVLFMEDYDINREGYHDSHDTLANIDLDYGSALTAVAIESVVRAANRAGENG